jgi:putative RNA 2'-phosphotransferase
VPGKLRKERAAPPDILYHGTVGRFLPAIREGGLRPMSRQYVHLSHTSDMASTVARRRGNDTVILTIRAAEAHAAGVPFYRESNGVWLADSVAPEWIELP